MSQALKPMRVKQVPLDDLPPDPKNPRRMSESQARKLMDSLERFGAVEPAVLNTTTNELVGGHMRVEAARVLGWPTYPTVFVELDPVQQRQLNLALNRIAGEWDPDLLAEVMLELNQSDADLGLTGFEDREIEKLLARDDDEGEKQARGALDRQGFQVIIDCRDEAHQAELLARFDAEGLSARPLMI